MLAHLHNKYLADGHIIATNEQIKQKIKPYNF